MIDFYSTDGHAKEEYEGSHGPRFDYFVNRFGLDKIKGKRVLDVGCGLGFLFDRMDKQSNDLIGMDYTALQTIPQGWWYVQHDLNLPFFENRFKDVNFDIIICSETIEHLQNPYNCLFEIKRFMNPQTVFYLTIPAESVQHNTLYPALFYPSENFDEFLHQMAFTIINKENHKAAFEQVVYTLKSHDWENNASRMRFYKTDVNQQGVPPHVAINL